MPPTCCPHASEQPNLWLCFLMILNGQSSNTHPRGHSYQKSILLQPSCCTDHTLQGFSRLCLQISPAAPDCHLESHCAKGDTYICPSLSPFHFLPVWHFTLLRAEQKYLQRIKRYGKTEVGCFIAWCKCW